MIPYLKLVVGVERLGLGANKDDVCLGSYMFDTGWIFRVCSGIRFLVNGIRCASDVEGFPFGVLDS